MVKARFCRLAILAVVLVVVQVTLASSYTPWPYIQIYPPVNETDVRTPLYFALVLSFGGNFRSIAALPGVQIALDYVNSNPSFLPGYSLHYTLLDSQCDHSTAVSTFFQEINNPPIKVGWVGSGCSLATEPTAELTQFYNITQLSCVSSSPELKDRRRFRYYFQLVATEVLIAQGFYGIIKKFGWKRVGVIVQDENLFTASLDALKQELTGDGVNCTEKRFRSDEGISGLGAEIFEPGVRVYVLMMYSPHARDILCEAYKSGLRYPKHMIITYGWYANNWWMGGPATFDQYGCTAYERASVLLYTLAPVIREYPVNFSAPAEPDNITAAEFWNRFFDVVDRDINQKILDSNEDLFVYSYNCHEATIAFAYALNKTIEDLIKNDTVNSKAAKESGLPEGANFTMADFTYANSVVVSRMFTHLQNTSFPGISGNEVRFNKEGTRDVNAVAILQYQPLNGVLVREHELVREQVALVIYSDGNNTFFQDNTLMLPDGVPNDGTVESPNNGHGGDEHCVHSSEVVPSSEVLPLSTIIIISLLNHE